MKKYRQVFPKSAFIFYGAVNLVSIAAIVFSALKLAGVGELVSYFLFVDITTIAIFVFFMALTAILLFRAYYGFEEGRFVVCRGFSRAAVEADRLAKFIYDEPSGVGALYYVDPLTPTAAHYLVINVRRAVIDDFIEDLRRLKSDVVIEFNPAPPKVDV